MAYFMVWGEERNTYTVARSLESKVTENINSVQSSLKFHPLLVSWYLHIFFFSVYFVDFIILYLNCDWLLLFYCPVKKNKNEIT